MKKDEIPQDEGSLAKVGVNELCYAVDENGNYTTAHSSGWEVKNAALDESMQLIEERVAKAKQDFLDGKTSPIPYFMELHRMDVKILAGYVGIHRWFVRRHFNPKRFKKLSDITLKKYADVFNISVEELKNFKPD